MEKKIILPSSRSTRKMGSTPAVYIFQTLGTLFSSDKAQVKNITTTSSIIRSSQNTTFLELQQQSYAYQFIFLYDLADFVAGASSAQSAGNAVILSHDQIRLNYQIPLGNNLTINGILASPELSSYLPLENCSPATAINAGEFVSVIQQALPSIISQCPVDVTGISNFQPVYYSSTFTFENPCGSFFLKTATTGVMRYRSCSAGNPTKVILWGTGISFVPITPST
jgi:hypothetical protein